MFLEFICCCQAEILNDFFLSLSRQSCKIVIRMQTDVYFRFIHTWHFGPDFKFVQVTMILREMIRELSVFSTICLLSALRASLMSRVPKEVLYFPGSIFSFLPSSLYILCVCDYVLMFVRATDDSLRDLIWSTWWHSHSLGGLRINAIHVCVALMH